MKPSQIPVLCAIQYRSTGVSNREQSMFKGGDMLCVFALERCPNALPIQFHVERRQGIRWDLSQRQDSETQRAVFRKIVRIFTLSTIAALCAAISQCHRHWIPFVTRPQKRRRQR